MMNQAKICAATLALLFVFAFSAELHAQSPYGYAVSVPQHIDSTSNQYDSMSPDDWGAPSTIVAMPPLAFSYPKKPALLQVQPTLRSVRIETQVQPKFIQPVVRFVPKNFSPVPRQIAAKQ